jgi:hypothetical protein
MATRTQTDRGVDASRFSIERNAAGFEVTVEIQTPSGVSDFITLTQAEIVAAVPVAADRTTTRTVLGQLYTRALLKGGYT